MRRAELRRVVRQQRMRLRHAAVRMRQEARERLRRNPTVRRERARRRVRQAVGLAALLLLITLLRCGREEPWVPPRREPPLAAPMAPARREAAPTSKPSTFKGRLAAQPRPAFRGEQTPPPAWLDAFRLQVAARSPRLALCFMGTDRPGALRWSAAVSAASGVVSDHALEPVGPGPTLSGAQRECVLRALSSPAYRLEVQAAGALPDRVSLVIEF